MKKPIRILFVEDDPAMAAVYADNFEPPDFITRTCSSGQEALNILHKEKEPFDIVVTDQEMPEIDGLTLLKKIKESHPKVRTIMITSYGNWISRVNTKKIGLERLMNKPVKMSELKKIVKTVPHRKEQ